MHGARQRNEVAHVLLVQRSMEAYAGSAIQQTFEHFSNRLHFSKPHSKSSNALDTLELHVTLLTPDLATCRY